MKSTSMGMGFFDIKDVWFTYYENPSLFIRYETSESDTSKKVKPKLFLDAWASLAPPMSGQDIFAEPQDTLAEPFTFSDFHSVCQTVFRFKFFVS